jgi:hypothetical protein
VAEGTVAIHQPNFFPWLGYFDKIARADVFVLLDDAQFSKQSRTNRVQVLVDGEASWLTAPVRRDGKVAISEARFDETKPWRKKALKTIRFSYAKAPHFDEVFPRIEELVGSQAETVGAYNEAAIRSLAEALGLGGTRMVRSSELGVDETATGRLVGIVAELDGAAYLEGGGASGYQEDEAFERAGIELLRQGFEHPAYPQGGAEFVPGLSVIDALMSCGFEGTRELLGR